jgi:hypothetical protein
MRVGAFILAVAASSAIFACAEEASQSDEQLATEAALGEVIRPNEEQEFAGFAERIQALQEAHRDATGGAVKRGFHAKIHGCVQGELTVRDDVPEEARVGLFAEARSYPAWIRFSNGQGRSRPDKERDVRGLAVKLVGVPGKKLLEIERDAVTHDFLMTNRRASHVDDAKQFMEFADATATSGKLALYLLKHPRVALRLAKVKKNVASVLTEQYWSGGAYALGSRAIKFSAKPCEISSKTMPASPSDDYLREDLRRSLAQGDACFDFMVQFRMDPDDFPVEKASVEWDEEISPFVPVARLVIPRLDLDAPEEAERAAKMEAYCEKLSFTPWHALPEHRPLGHINRARKAVYQASREGRSVEEYVAEPDGSETF